MAEISFDDFLKFPHQELKKYSLILLNSKDEFDLHEAMGALRQASLKLEVISPNAFDDIGTKLQETSLFDQGGSIYYLSGGDTLTKEMVKTIEKAIHTKTNHKLIIEATTHPELQKLAKKEGLLVFAPSLKPWEIKTKIERWIVTCITTSGASIEPAAVEFLVREFSNNRFLIQKELEKLICYVQRGKITLEVIHDLVSAQSKKPLYEIHDALLRKDKKKMLTMVHNLEKEGVHPLQITRSLRNQLRQDLLRDGLQPKRIELVNQAGDGYIMAALMKIDAGEVELKNQSQDEFLTLERTMCAL